jgi:DNA-binding NtrC family response regulator
VAGLLRDEGYRTSEAETAAAARALLADHRDPPELLLLDIRMPGEDGLALLRSLPQPLPLPVVVLSGEASISDAVAALKLGATDFVEKPPSPERLLTAVRNALSLAELAAERERLLAELARPGQLLGVSPAMDELRRLVARVGPSPSTVLISGETGTGKERVARALHLASGRRGRFIAVNCAAIPAALLESELFEHEKGAFSGAVARHAGRLEQANGGTLLLDEIGDMPLELQGKLLRAIEAREVERLGGSAPVAVDVRFLAATNRDLGRRVTEGEFREDLFYRLNVFPLTLPPLRARPEDVLPLALAFAGELLGPRTSVRVTAAGEAVLRGYAWPGNVRELRNLVERLALLRPDDAELVIGGDVVSCLGPPAPAAGAPAAGAPAAGAPAAEPSAPAVAAGPSLREQLEAHERRVIRAALERADGNIAAAARELKLDRGNLHRRLRSLGLLSLETGRPGAD